MNICNLKTNINKSFEFALLCSSGNQGHEDFFLSILTVKTSISHVQTDRGQTVTHQNIRAL